MAFKKELKSKYTPKHTKLHYFSKYLRWSIPLNLEQNAWIHHACRFTTIETNCCSSPIVKFWLHTMATPHGYNPCLHPMDAHRVGKSRRSPPSPLNFVLLFFCPCRGLLLCFPLMGGPFQHL